MEDEQIFTEAAKLCGSARDAFLDDACGGDLSKRSHIEKLLTASEASDSMLDVVHQHDSLASTTEAVKQGKHPVIGNYKLLHKLGEGGFGVVYMAEQLAPVRRKVALKIVKVERLGDASATIARFEAERQALAMMDHPNIAKVFDGGAIPAGPDVLSETLEVAERPFFVMELVNGVPITEYCDRNNLPNRERLELFITVCQAVQHAHQKGVIHRDLKPSNILVTLHDGNPVVKVIDFGVAKAINQQLTDKTLYTILGDMIGTPLYMSPEQAERSGLDIDTRSDIYSLGVLLYELLTGTTPITAEDLKEAGIIELQKRIVESELPRPSTRLSNSGNELTVIAKHRSIAPEKLHGELIGELDWIVMKALDKDRNRRYDTAKGFANDVQNFLNHDVVLARPPSAFYLLQKASRKYKGVIATASVVLLSLLAVLLGLGLSSYRTGVALSAERIAKRNAEESHDLAETANNELRTANYAFQIESAFRAWEMGSLDRLRDLLNQSKPADPSQTDLRGFEWRLLKQRYDDNFPKQTRRFDEQVVDVKFSPDDKFLAALLSDGSLFVARVGHLKDGLKIPTPLARSNRGGGGMRRLAFASETELLLAGKNRDNESEGRGILLRFELQETAPLVKSRSSWSFEKAISELAYAGNAQVVVVFSGVVGNGTAHLFDLRADPVDKGVVFEGRFPDVKDGVVVTQSLAGSITNNYVWLYELASGKQLKRFPTGTQPRASLAPDRSRLLISDSSGTSCYKEQGNTFARTRLSWRRSGAMQYVPQSDCFAFSFIDSNCVSVVDAETNEEVARYLHENRVLKIDVSHDGRWVASGSRDRTLKIWPLPGHEQDFSRGAATWFAPLAVAQNGNTVAYLSSTNSSVRVRRTEHEDTLFEMQDEGGISHRVKYISMDDAGTMLVASSDSASTCKLWNIADEEEIPLPVRGTGAELSPDGQRMLVAGESSFWMLEIDDQGQVGNEWELDAAFNERFARWSFSQDSKYLAVGGRNTDRVHLYDIAEKSFKTMKVSQGTSSLAFSADNQFLAVSGFTSEISLFDLYAEKRLELHCRGDWVTSVRFSPDGKTLAAASPNGEIEFWRLPSGQPVGSIMLHKGVRKIEFSQDGNRLYWSSMDGDVGYLQAAAEMSQH